MKGYLSIDLETTGLNPDGCRILTFGAVYDDMVSPVDKLKSIHLHVLQRDGQYPGEEYALKMNEHILTDIQNLHRGLDLNHAMHVSLFCFEDELVDRIKQWLHLQCGVTSDIKITLAGANAAMFDIVFLNKRCEFSKKLKHGHRVIDVANLYWNPEEHGSTLPSLPLCKKIAGFAEEVSHDALEDAFDVVFCIRRKFNLSVESCKRPKLIKPTSSLGRRLATALTNTFTRIYGRLSKSFKSLRKTSAA